MSVRRQVWSKKRDYHRFRIKKRRLSLIERFVVKNKPAVVSSGTFVTCKGRAKIDSYIGACATPSCTDYSLVDLIGTVITHIP